MPTAYFRHLTMRRKAALVFAVVWLLVFGAFLLPAALRIAPPEWSTFYIVFAGAYNAIAVATLAVEIVRIALARPGIHNDATHFRWVAVVIVFLLAVSALAYLFALGPQP